MDVLILHIAAKLATCITMHITIIILLLCYHTIYYYHLDRAKHGTLLAR